jgi:large subunit ribosomal protein L14e
MRKRNQVGDVMIEPGRVCIKKSGRDAGDKCVVINVLDKKFVEIVSASRKKARKCNMMQLTPLSQKVNPQSEEEIKNALS